MPLNCINCIVVLSNSSSSVRDTWWRHQMDTFSALLALCAGNSPVPVNSPHKGQWRRALMFSLMCAWINGWVNNREAGDLRRNRAHYYDNVMNFEGHAVPSTTKVFKSQVLQVLTIGTNNSHKLLPVQQDLQMLHLPVHPTPLLPAWGRGPANFAETVVGAETWRNGLLGWSIRPPAMLNTLDVRGPSYLGLTRSISWLLLPWLLTSPGHQ